MNFKLLLFTVIIFLSAVVLAKARTTNSFIAKTFIRKGWLGMQAGQTFDDSGDKFRVNSHQSQATIIDGWVLLENVISNNKCDSIWRFGVCCRVFLV